MGASIWCDPVRSFRDQGRLHMTDAGRIRPPAVAFSLWPSECAGAAAHRVPGSHASPVPKRSTHAASLSLRCDWATGASRLARLTKPTGCVRRRGGWADSTQRGALSGAAPLAGRPATTSVNGKAKRSKQACTRTAQAGRRVVQAATQRIPRAAGRGDGGARLMSFLCRRYGYGWMGHHGMRYFACCIIIQHMDQFTYKWSE